MQKALSAIAFFLFMSCSLSLSAQSFGYYEQAVGIRAGSILGVSYKNLLSHPHGYEIIGGLRLNNGQSYSLAGLYQYHVDIGFNTNFDAYAGGGLVTGVYVRSGEKPKFGIGLVPCIGLAYTFRLAPISVSLDYMPQIGTHLSWAEGAFTARYTFGKRY